MVVRSGRRRVSSAHRLGLGPLVEGELPAEERLRRVALERGVRLHEHSRVSRIDRRSPPVVRTAQGALTLQGDAAEPFFCWDTPLDEWAEPESAS